MKPIVFNSTPMIYLSKAGLSRIIENLKAEKLMSLLVSSKRCGFCWLAMQPRKIRKNYGATRQNRILNN
jgi:hypothetical protein